MRVLSLLPASTEIVCALGAGRSLVGITHECDFPADLVSALPRVTRATLDEALRLPGDIDRAIRAQSESGQPLYTLDDTAIMQLAPDLIVTQALCDVCAVSETDVRAITARMPATPTVVTLSGSTWAGVADDIRRVGTALCDDGAAARLIESLEQRLLAVHEILRAARAPRPRVALIEWTDPIFTAGHWVPELVRRAGGHDVLATAGEHSSVRTVQEIRIADPEILVIAPCGYDAARAADAARTLIAASDWEWAHDIPVWAMDANSLLSRPGPRLVDGTEVLAAIMHPGLFRTPTVQSALRVR